MRTTFRWAGLCLLLGLPLVAQEAAGAEDFHGSWIGWAYDVDGSNFPLRLHVAGEEGTLEVTMDSPGADAWGIDLTGESIVDGTLAFVREVDATTRNVYSTRLERGELVGWADRNGERWYRMVLLRSPAAVVPADPERTHELKGIYRTAGGELIQVSSWPWNENELMVHELESGLRVTAFCAGPGRFLIGSWFGAPRGPVAELRVRRAADGSVEGLSRSLGGEEAFFERLTLRERTVRYESDGVTLEGTLVLPVEPGTYPAVVLQGGGSWRGREDTRRFADAFAAQGIAAFCYDKRGSGRSGGSRPNSMTRIARDAVEAHSAVCAEDEVDPDHVGFFGFSRGGWQVPLAAAETDACAFAIVLAGPSVSPRSQESTRRLNRLRDLGVDAEGIRIAEAYLERLWHFAVHDRGWDEYVSAREDIAARGWLGILGGEDSPEPTRWQWYRLNAEHDPLPAIRAQHSPVRVFLGGADRNVTPESNAGPWREALSESASADWQVRVLSRADHMMFLAAADGSPAEIHAIEGSVPGLWPEIAAWVRSLQ